MGIGFMKMIIIMASEQTARKVFPNYKPFERNGLSC